MPQPFIVSDEHLASHEALARECLRLHRQARVLLAVTLVNMALTLLTLVLRLL